MVNVLRKSKTVRGRAQAEERAQKSVETAYSPFSSIRVTTRRQHSPVKLAPFLGSKSNLEEITSASHNPPVPERPALNHAKLGRPKRERPSVNPLAAHGAVERTTDAQPPATWTRTNTAGASEVDPCPAVAIGIALGSPSLEVPWIYYDDDQRQVDEARDKRSKVLGKSDFTQNSSARAACNDVEIQCQIQKPRSWIDFGLRSGENESEVISMVEQNRSRRSPGIDCEDTGLAAQRTTPPTHRSASPTAHRSRTDELARARTPGSSGKLRKIPDRTSLEHFESASRPLRSTPSPVRETIDPTVRPEGGRKALMLDVDIPKFELERYSVMFGSVLKESSAPPFIAQGRLVQNPRTSKRVIQETPHNATPKVTARTSSSPSAVKARGPSRRPPSIVVTGPPPPKNDEAREVSGAKSNPPSRFNNPPTYHSPSERVTSDTKPQNESHFVLMITSPVELTGHPVVDVKSDLSRSPKTSPEEHDMIPAPVAQVGPMTSWETHSRRSDEEDPLLRFATELSISRQISVSQRQRQALLPVICKSERLVDRTVLSPTMVEGQHSHTRQSHQATWHKV
ncbi:MAG: hypothetical protein M1833_001183 [Piccolia ochrophora]|nr:MAG: hypothetical protein M1833_001183 [Piccolia ochrophora]